MGVQNLDTHILAVMCRTRKRWWIVCSCRVVRQCQGVPGAKSEAELQLAMSLPDVLLHG